MKNKKITNLLLILIALPTLAFAQNKNFWSQAEGKNISQENIRKSVTTIEKSEIYNLDLSSFKNAILQAPYRFEGVTSNIEITLPTGDSSFDTFTLYKAQTMSKELAAKFSKISSYVGISKDKTHTVRLTLTSQGIFGTLSTEKGTLYINPYTFSGYEYQVFYRRNTINNTPFSCLVEGGLDTSKNSSNETTANLADVDDSILRRYRLAVATTGEYSQFHITQSGNTGSSDAVKKQAVMDAIVAVIDRVNTIYEQELATTFTLVNNNEDLIYLNANTDPFNNTNANVLINQSQQEIDATIGNANYDIGHTFSTGGGGLAQLASVCSDPFKARGITGLPQPIGDSFAIDFVCHEIGHQFGSPHTFNGDTQNCAGTNRNNATAVEPGSGSTIMAYAGICSPENVQNSSDDYFHAISIQLIYNNLAFSTGGSCAEEINLNNSAPQVNSLPNYTIPYGTAFELTASATDADGDNLTYCWEQIDNEITPAPPTPDATQGPVFRSFEPTVSPTRYFPSKSSVLAGDLAPTWEVISNQPREYNFAVTVRDNNPIGAQSRRRDTKVTVANTGPFVVTSQNTPGISYDQNEAITVTWNVAGTTGNGINTSNVDIYLSYNGGITFELVGIGHANTGSSTFQLPIGTSSTFCRFKVKGRGNVFYAINSELFEITDQLATDTNELSQLFNVYPNPNNGNFTINFNEASGADYTAKVYDLRGRLISNTMISTSESLTKQIDLNQPQSGIYILKVSNGSQESVKKLIIE
ncbi:reprolysin-like metallopeptidase [Mesonia sp. K4-1]|uniref:reprolysin-like metallopeptidase n=1 Tax=Mesonia sp. K4-1 TaxID=2602760 RepID=UPI0011CCD154|nr:zinc-dependent metalloprotease family protein [Mesonia sp. K4-1]TXK76861.1 T9SS type A sorting domain-containing protein [Mesonia sp. K4-1]